MLPQEGSPQHEQNKETVTWLPCEFPEHDFLKTMNPGLRGVIEGKGWYTGIPKTDDHCGKEFDWDLSATALWEQLATVLREHGVKGLASTTGEVTQWIKHLMESSFTEYSQYQVTKRVKTPQSTEVESKTCYFLDAVIALISKYNAELKVWTVGDALWQRTKAERTKIFERVREEDFWSDPVDKFEYLRREIAKYLQEHLGEDIHVFVVDDKEKNVARAKQVLEALGPRVHVTDFIISDHPARRHHECMRILTDQLNYHAGMKTFVILDKDGVIIESDWTMRDTFLCKFNAAFNHYFDQHGSTPESKCRFPLPPSK